MIRKGKNEVSPLNLTSLWWNHIVLKLTNYKCTNWTLFTQQTKSLYRISVLEPWKTGVWSLTEKHPSSTIPKCPPVPTDSGWLLSSHMSSHTWYAVWCCIVSFPLTSWSDNQWLVLFHSGLETSWLWDGGTTCGSMKDLPHMCHILELIMPSLPGIL